MEILTAEDLTFTYAGQTSPALKNINISVKRGELVCICGPTGSGKSTLLRLLKKEIAPRGELTGDIRLFGRGINGLTDRESAKKIAFVAQRPEEQIVTDRVSSELCFCAENLGVAESAAMPRIAETAALFGLSDIYDAETSSLSGGQKQLLCLGSALVTSPELILLDEPASRLDPVAAEELIAAVVRLNRQRGVTVLIAEHDTERIIEYADRLAILEDGALTAYGKPSDVLSKKPSEAVLSDMPAPVRLFYRLGKEGECPLSVKAGRETFADAAAEEYGKPELSSEIALRMKNVWFRYGKDGEDVLSGADLTLRRGEIKFLFGSNGSGKSTLLGCAAGLLRHYSGKVEIFSKDIRKYTQAELYKNNVSLLCQDVMTVFMHDFVRDEFKGFDTSKLPYDISGLLDRHPYDLSGGEAQIAALCRVLCAEPRLLLLDEPTKGLDSAAKRRFADILKNLAKQGTAILVVSHDAELAAEAAHTCAMIFQGRIVSDAPAADFIKNNDLYTTAVCRMTDGRLIK